MTCLALTLPLLLIASSQSYQKCLPSSGKCIGEDSIDADTASLIQAYSLVVEMRVRNHADISEHSAAALPRSIAPSQKHELEALAAENDLAQTDLRDVDGARAIQHASLTRALLYDLGVRISQFRKRLRFHFWKLPLSEEAYIQPFAGEAALASRSPTAEEKPDLSLIGADGSSPRTQPVLETQAAGDNVVVLVVGFVLVLAVLGFAVAMIVQPASAGLRLNMVPKPYASGAWSTASRTSSTGSLDGLKQGAESRSLVSLVSGAFFQTQEDPLRSSSSIPTRPSVDSLSMSFGPLSLGTAQAPPALLGRPLKPVQGLLVPDAPVPVAMRPLANFARRVLARRPGPEGPETVLSPKLLVPEAGEVVFALPSLLNADRKAPYHEYKIADEQGRPLLGVVVDRTPDAGNPGMSERIALVDWEGRKPHGYCEIRRAAGHGAPQATILSADVGEQFFLGEAPNPHGLRALLICSAAAHGARRMVIQVHSEQGRGASVSSPDRFCAAMVEGPGFAREGGEYYTVKIGPSIDAGLVILALLALDRLPAITQGPAAARVISAQVPAVPGLLRAQATGPPPLQVSVPVPVARRPPGPPQGPHPQSQQQAPTLGTSSGMPLGTPACQPRFSL